MDPKATRAVAAVPEAAAGAEPIASAVAVAAAAEPVPLRPLPLRPGQQRAVVRSALDEVQARAVWQAVRSFCCPAPRRCTRALCCPWPGYGQAQSARPQLGLGGGVLAVPCVYVAVRTAGGVVSSTCLP